jgi:two-component system, OmpR family, sensor histidine kinase ResE
MFRHLRSKIIFSFCLLMIAGGGLSTTLVDRNISSTLGASVDRNGISVAEALASQLTEPLAYGDRISVRRLLTEAQASNSDMSYALVVSPSGEVADHSFPKNAFPEDLLKVVPRVEAATLRTERGTVRDLPVPLMKGLFGTLHIGVSMTWVETARADATKNVLFTTALAMAVGIAGILFLASLITRPLSVLREAAVKLGEGDASASAPVSGSDEIAELANTFNDMARQIRERMAESEQLREYVEGVLDHMDSGILAVNEAGAVQYANRVVEQAHGPLVGLECRILMDGERPCAECPATGVMASGRVANRRYKAASGRSYDLTYVPMIGRDGRRSVVERARDVTEQLELHERFQRAQRLAVAGEIAASVVHSVNNPLDGVQRALALAADRPTDHERLNRMLSLAMEGTERIAALTRVLLGFAREGPDYQPVPIDPITLVEAAVKLARLKAVAGGVSITVELEQEIPRALMDPQAMEEVFVNLLMNAVDACEGGGGVVVRIRVAQDEMVEIQVSDSGPGVDPNVAERIFEPFFTTKEADRGTGLGLSVARRVVEAHSGFISLVHCGTSGGAVFSVRLPAHRDPVASGEWHVSHA